MSETDSAETHTEIAVVGAGPAGLAAALSLAQTGFEVICVGQPFTPSDTRTTALLQPSIELLEDLGVWEDCRAEAAPLNTLRLIDDTGRLFRAPDAAFHAAELGEGPFGYNIPNQALVLALHRAIAERERVTFQPTEAVTDVAPGDDSVRVTLTEGGGITARLVVGADGRRSLCRRTAGIKVQTWDYPQTAIACNFAHTRPHDDTCIELHTASGPLTVVPLPGDRSSLVWVETPEETKRLMALDEPGFARELARSLHFALGRVTEVGPRGTFPLSGLHARDFAANRIALVGEAAHVVPPIGAQGLNLGYRDVRALARTVKESSEDPGGEDVMRAYNLARRGDVMTRTLAADMLNRTLYSGFLPFQLARGAGLYLVNTVGPLRRLLMREGITPAGPGRLSG
jgi:2-octaprenyl-6-methoxyphenol hydroxylase